MITASLYALETLSNDRKKVKFNKDRKQKLKWNDCSRSHSIHVFEHKHSIVALNREPYSFSPSEE